MTRPNAATRRIPAAAKTPAGVDLATYPVTVARLAQNDAGEALGVLTGRPRRQWGGYRSSVIHGPPRKNAFVHFENVNHVGVSLGDVGG